MGYSTVLNVCPTFPYVSVHDVFLPKYILHYVNEKNNDYKRKQLIFSEWIEGCRGYRILLPNINGSGFMGELPGQSPMKTELESAQSSRSASCCVSLHFLYCPSEHNNYQQLFYITRANGFIRGTSFGS
jgi:hypothetical protein